MAQVYKSCQVLHNSCLVPGTRYLVIWYHEYRYCAQVHCFVKPSKCINFFQGNLVADYDVTKYFKAYGGAMDSQQTPGINDNLDYEKCCW